MILMGSPVIHKNNLSYCHEKILLWYGKYGKNKISEGKKQTSLPSRYQMIAPGRDEVPGSDKKRRQRKTERYLLNL